MHSFYTYSSSTIHLQSSHSDIFCQSCSCFRNYNHSRIFQKKMEDSWLSLFNKCGVPVNQQASFRAKVVDRQLHLAQHSGAKSISTVKTRRPEQLIGHRKARELGVYDVGGGAASSAQDNKDCTGARNKDSVSKKPVLPGAAIGSDDVVVFPAGGTPTGKESSPLHLPPARRRGPPAKQAEDLLLRQFLGETETPTRQRKRRFPPPKVAFAQFFALNEEWNKYVVGVGDISSSTVLVGARCRVLGRKQRQEMGVREQVQVRGRQVLVADGIILKESCRMLEVACSDDKLRKYPKDLVLLELWLPGGGEMLPGGVDGVDDAGGDEGRSGTTRKTILVHRS